MLDLGLKLGKLGETCEGEYNRILQGAAYPY